MADSGYSGTPLAKKLGIKAGFQMYGYQLPDEYFNLFETLPDDLNLIAQEDLENIDEASLDWAHLFFKERQAFEEVFAIVKTKIKKNGSIWISWPKKAAKVKTDVDQFVVRTVGLKIGLVDVKVASVSEIWSGMKFMYRIKDR
ncbi:DUF3052 domain-containing protein [marine bacterium AO1-C]|nr:DUF3052 domain-containing protein [marine bacterium AO1-C]